MKTVYLMRHGRTLFNVMGLNQGMSDSPLTKEGIEAYMFTSTLQSHGNQGKFADDAAVRFVCNQFGLREPNLY